jgi:hypothetical protein
MAIGDLWYASDAIRRARHGWHGRSVGDVVVFGDGVAAVGWCGGFVGFDVVVAVGFVADGG